MTTNGCALLTRHCSCVLQVLPKLDAALPAATSGARRKMHL
jgi:hypothetical protein